MGNSEAVLLSADFENGLPAGWQVSGTPGWVFNDPGGRGNQTGGSGKFAIADSDRAGKTPIDTTLETPVLDLSGYSSVKLKYKTYFLASGSSTTDVDVSLDGGESWNNAWSQQSADFQGAVTVDLTDLAGGQANVKLRFHYYEASNDWYWQVDEVRVEALVGLAAPAGLTATPQGLNIDLHWNSGGDGAAGFKVERSPDGSSSWVVAASLAANASSFSDKNLTCNTPYYYRVRAFNGVLSSDPSSTAHAQTAACTATAGISESFDAGSLPAGWTVRKNQGSLGWVFNDPGGRKNRTGGSGAFAIADSDQEGGLLDTELRTPAINLAGQPAVLLSFKTMLQVNETKTTVASVDLSQDGGQTWTNAWRKTGDFKGAVTLDISLQAANRSNVMVRFHYKANNEYYWQVDDVRLEPLAAPAAPASLAASLAPTGAVNLSWRGNSTARIKVERATAGCSAWTQIDTLASGAVTFMDGSVADSTAYCYRVTATNAAGTSAPSEVVSITSGKVSVTPVDLTISLHAAAKTGTAAERAPYEAILKYFADGVYESSNTANKLRRITIFTGGAKADSANVKWVAKCWPMASPSGYGKEGSSIEMCDLFSSQNYLQDDYLNQAGGYGALTHEFGHYFYGLYDEYVGSKASTDPSDPQPRDKPPDFSVMRSSDPAGDTESQPGDLRALNFSAAVNYAPNTAQGRVFGASCWETIARDPSLDPRTALARGRLYHPEVAAVAPKAGERPVIDLTGAVARQAARSLLKIVWSPAPASQVLATGDDFSTVMASTVSGSVIRQVVIDRSAAMSDTGKLAEVNAAVAQVIDQAQTGDILGLIAYDGAAGIVQPLTSISGQSDKDTLYAALDTIQGGSADAALGEALQLALDGLTAPGVPSDTQRIVYLITSGQDDSGVYPLSVIPGYAENFVSLMVVGYGAQQAEEVMLRQLAQQAGGKYSPAQNASELSSALLNFDRINSLEVEANIKTGWQEVQAGSSFSVPFTMDSSLSRLDPLVAYQGDPGELRLELSDPQHHTTVLSSTADCESQGAGDEQRTICSLSLDAPVTGTWQLRAQPQAGPVFVAYWIDGVARSDQQAYALHLRLPNGAVVNYPQPIVVEALLTADLPVAGAVMSGTVEDPEGVYDTFQLHDDGLAPDRMAADGVYSAYVDYWTGGKYQLTVQANNSAGTALATDKGLSTTGSVPDRAITENFERYAGVVVDVAGWQPDDHTNFSDNLLWLPTSLPLDNQPLHGRIDFAGDTDVFSLTVPAEYTGTLGLRVDGLGLEMIPAYHLFASDWSWEVERSLGDAAAGEAIFIPLPVKPGEGFFVEIRHSEDTAQSGTYDISAGPYLASDPGFLPKTQYIVYLPAVHHAR